MRYLAFVMVLMAGSIALAEEFSVATWNVENFRDHFLAFSLGKQNPRDQRPAALDEAIRALQAANDEDQWEVAQVILDKEFAPDVLMLQEAASESDLQFFCRKWLRDGYSATVFPTNTEESRQQNLAMLLKPGFTVVETKTFRDDPDPAGANDRGNRLFARGPAFVLIETPGGYRFWCGTNHQKSKATGRIPGLRTNDLEGVDWENVPMDDESAQKKIDATKWRNREARRTHEIIEQLRKAGPDDVVFVGDMNDDYGVNRFDKEGGGDTIQILLGEGNDALVLLTKPLIEKKDKTFEGYWRSREGGFIDHILVTPEMKDQVIDTKVFRNRFTSVASDHMPVVARFRSQQRN